MNNIIRSMALAIVLTLAVYFKGTLLKCSSDGINLFIIIVASIVSGVAALIGFLDERITIRDAVPTSAASIIAAIALTTGVVTTPAVLVASTIIVAMSTIIIAAAQQQPYWKVFLVYLLGIASIATPIYLHLRGPG